MTTKTFAPTTSATKCRTLCGRCAAACPAVPALTRLPAWAGPGLEVLCARDSGGVCSAHPGSAHLRRDLPGRGAPLDVSVGAGPELWHEVRGLCFAAPPRPHADTTGAQHHVPLPAARRVPGAGCGLGALLPPAQQLRGGCRLPAGRGRGCARLGDWPCVHHWPGRAHHGATQRRSAAACVHVARAR